MQLLANAKTGKFLSWDHGLKFYLANREVTECQRSVFMN